MPSGAEKIDKKQGGCCSAKEIPSAEEDQRGCCSAKEVATVDKTLGACCLTRDTHSVDKKRGDCCSTKEIPSAEENHGCCSTKEISSAKNDQGGCCSSKKTQITDKDQGGCCLREETLPTDADRAGSYPSKETATEVPACCGFSKEKSCESTRSSTSGPISSTSCSSEKSGCCPSGPMDPSSTRQSCCGAPPAKDTPKQTCTDFCCTVNAIDEANIKNIKSGTWDNDLPNVTVSALDAVDVEKGLGLAGTEHVVLSISGMTCTGCETKLQRSIANLQSIKHLKTSLLLARAEFDVDLAAASAMDVIRHIERTTEFKCTKVDNVGSELDIIPNGDLHEFLCRSLPPGVTSIERVDKKVVRVFFDSKIIGARHLLESFEGKVEVAPPTGDPALSVGNKHVRRLGLMTLLSALLTIPVLVLAWAPIHERPITYASVSLALATIVQFVVAGPFYSNALKALVFSRMIEIDLLIVLSTSAAYIFSVVSFGYIVRGIPLSTGDFFETSTLLVTLIMVGRFLSALARQKAVESISIRSLQVSTAILVAEDGLEEREIDTRLLQYGDMFKVMPDSRIPTDGTVVSGSSEIDESMITGESRPVEKYFGSTVIAGSINSSGTLLVRLTRLPGDNSISTIAGMIDEAKLSKPKLQDIADKVATYFVPGVILLTIITLVIWIGIGLKVRKQSGSEAVVQAITYAITVLIVSCPCAIGLAVPMVVVIAGGVAAEHGVVFKSAHALEVALKTSHIVFDKTGTLTQGKLAVEVEEYLGGQQDILRAEVLGLVLGIKHPVSTAVALHLTALGTKAAQIEDVRILTGKGVEGTLNGTLIRAGNSRWLQTESNPRVQSLLSKGYTVFCVMVGTKLSAIFGLEDSLRPEATATVLELQKRNIAVSIVSGDDDGAVRHTAAKLGISSFRSECSPADKRDYLRAIMTDEKIITIFCGDGTNDAVALAQATIGVHINDTSEIAQSASDVVLVSPSINGILLLIDVSRAAVRRIAFNFGWSFVYNLVAILLAAGAFVHARIPPEYAGLGELVSVLPVIFIALQLRWANFSKV